MIITSQCPFCGRQKSLNLLKIVGDIKECECTALYLVDTDSETVNRLTFLAAAKNNYDPRDDREGIAISGGIVYRYGTDDVAYLAWTRRVPNMQEVRNGFRVESGDWLKNKCSCCGGQIKITGIFTMDTGDMVCWACENYTGADGHESGNFTVANNCKFDFLPSRMEL